MGHRLGLGGGSGAEVTVYDGPYAVLPEVLPAACDVRDATCTAPLAAAAWATLTATTESACGEASTVALGVFEVVHGADALALVPAVVVADGVVVRAADWAAWTGSAPAGATLTLAVGADGITPDPTELAALLPSLAAFPGAPAITGTSASADGDCAVIGVQGTVCDACGNSCAFATTLTIAAVAATAGDGPVTAPE